VRKVITITLIAATVLGSIYIPLSSPIAASVLWSEVDSQEQIKQWKIEIALLVSEQQEKNMYLKQLSADGIILEKDIQAVTERYRGIQQELHMINTEIAELPTPIYDDLEKIYNDNILVENARFEGQKVEYKKTYNSIVGELKRNYEIRREYISANYSPSEQKILLIQEEEKNTRERRHAFDDFTNKNLENDEKHQNSINDSMTSKMEKKKERLAYHQSIVMPLFERKDDISNWKSDTYSTKEELLKKYDVLQNEINITGLRIREIDTLVSRANYQLVQKDELN